MTRKLPEASKIKVIATDIDGTLLTPEGKVSERTKNVIRRILKKYPDLHFVLASGRSKPAAEQIRKDLDIEGRPHTESILCNGCIIYKVDGSILWQDTLSTEFLIKVHQTITPYSMEHVYSYSVGDDNILYEESWAKILSKEYEEKTVVVEREEYVKKIESGEIKVNKLGFLIPEPSKVEEYKRLLESVRKEYNIDWSYSDPFFLEYMPPHTNKGTGLKQLMERFNVKKESVMAFGDSGNDFELFRNAGWPVAMANACDELKSLAKLITKSNAEDGVADILEKIFLKDELMN